tara:strand:- start:508 stop:1827 length:1320 start_codon:yes stop_codon:yes gene_type:complete
MTKIHDSIEYQEIIKNLNNKNYLKALRGLKLISKNYSDENTILKLFAIIYFNLMEWENAIKYYKKILLFEKDKYKIYINIGVSYFKLGKINKSIDAFKNSIKDNPNIGLTYNNLGISYLEIGMFEKARIQFIYALKLNNNDFQAQSNLINTFNFKKPKDDNQHPLVKINNKINNLIKDNKINSEFNNNYVKILLEKSNEFIKEYKENLFLKETQIFRKNSENLNCGRHFKVFNEFNVIPKYCFGCYKIQINLKTVVDLIKLFLIFNKIKLKKNNIRKCIVELRDKIYGNYKGYIYCKGISEAESVKKEIHNMILKENININEITLKHGCSEFYDSYPKFKKINFKGAQEMQYDDDWESFEKIIDSREPQRIETDKKIWSKSLEDINLSDILIINNWISYAQITGDESYKNIYDKKINNNFVEDFLKDQLEFRQKSFKSI